MSLFTNDYPYTDFHELNLDFILEKIAEIEKYHMNVIDIDLSESASSGNIKMIHSGHMVVLDIDISIPEHTGQLEICELPSSIGSRNIVVYDNDNTAYNMTITSDGKLTYDDNLSDEIMITGTFTYISTDSSYTIE